MKRRILIALVMIAVLAGVYVFRARRDVVKQVFVDQQTLDAFLQAQEVTAERLKLDYQKGSPYELSSYQRDGSVKVSPGTIREVQQLLQKPSSYDWRPEPKACVVDYGVLLTFHSPEQPLRVAICFSCNWLGIFKGDDNSRHINAEMDFDPVRGKLVAIAKSIFPNDPDIQTLK